MSEMIDLALTYGGFTSLDKAYLQRKFAKMNHEEQLAFITPPPSVLNAYFAEYYQKESPQRATDYYFSLSQALNLFPEVPSFVEEKPFVRLNLSGQSYGFAYESREEEIAVVFSEDNQPPSDQVCFELATIFPHYQIAVLDGQIKMWSRKSWPVKSADLTLSQADLTQAWQLADGGVLLQGFNLEEILEVANQFEGQRQYGFEQRQYLLYINE